MSEDAEAEVERLLAEARGEAGSETPAKPGATEGVEPAPEAGKAPETPETPTETTSASTSCAVCATGTSVGSLGMGLLLLGGLLGRRRRGQGG